MYTQRAGRNIILFNQKSTVINIGSPMLPSFIAEDRDGDESLTKRDIEPADIILNKLKIHALASYGKSGRRNRFCALALPVVN